MSLSVAAVEQAVIARPFAAVLNDEINKEWARVATLNEDAIGAKMCAAFGCHARVPTICAPKKPPKVGKVGAETIAGRALCFLAQTGSGKSGDETPFRDGITAELWRTSFPYLRKRGLISGVGDHPSGTPHVWSLTEAGWAMVASYMEQI